MLKNSQVTPYRYARLIEAALGRDNIDFSDCTTPEEVQAKIHDILYLSTIQGPTVIKTEDHYVLMVPDIFDWPGEDTWVEIHQALLDGPVTGPLDQEKLGSHV